MRQNSGLAHCVHHDIHWEYCYDYRGRAEFIKANKPEDEQDLRLKLFKLIPNKLVPGIESKEWRSYVKAGQKFWKSKLFCIKATETYNKVWQSYLTAKEAEDKAEELYYDLTEETYKGESAYIKAGRSFAKAIETYIMAMKAFDKIGKAREAYEKAWEALEKANIAYYKARDAYYSKYANELQILHDEMFPDCTWDGKTIF
jgi:tetratricopeptide (TPR) repeat protein